MHKIKIVSKIIFMFILALLLPIILPLNSNAAEVLREIIPESPQAGSIIEVKINILNDAPSPISYEIEERIPGEVTLIEPKQPYEIRQQDGVKIPILKWNLLAEPGKITSVSYKIQAPNPGLLTFSPVKIFDTSTSEVSTGSSNELIITCNPDGTCNKPENYLNCPQDCSTGAKDNICNPIQDSICDVDCEKNADIDCAGQESDLTWLYYTIAIFLVVAIIAFVAIKFFKSREPEQPQQPQQPTQPQQPLQQQPQPQQTQTQSQLPQQPNQQDPLAGFPGSRNV